MEKIIYDVIVIGGGTAGIGTAKKLQENGFNVLIIEKDDFVTTCANVGCMPSKLLIAPAKDYYIIKNSYKKHIFTDNINIDDKAILNKVRNERDRFVSFVRQSANEIKNKIIGTASIEDKNTIKVITKDNKIYNFKTKTIVIATGSTPIISKELEKFKDIILTNENIFEIERLPKSLLVIGAGVIGLELGSALANLGVKTSIYSLNKSILGLDSEIKEEVINSMKTIYNDMIFNTEINHISYNIQNKEFIVNFANGKRIIVEQILLSIGRAPNLKNLNIDKLLNKDIKEILCNINKNTLSLNDDNFNNIFIAGDANNIEPLLHVASDDSTRILNSIKTFINNEKNDIYKRKVFLSIVFSIPYQISIVGQQKDFDKSIIFSWENQGRSRIEGKNFGKMKMFFKEKKLVGFQNIGPDAEHLAHLLAWQIESENNEIEKLLSMPYYHPTIEEGLRTALRMGLNEYI